MDLSYQSAIEQLQSSVSDLAQQVPRPPPPSRTALSPISPHTHPAQSLDAPAAAAAPNRECMRAHARVRCIARMWPVCSLVHQIEALRRSREAELLKLYRERLGYPPVPLPALLLPLTARRSARVGPRSTRHRALADSDRPAGLCTARAGRCGGRGQRASQPAASASPPELVTPVPSYCDMYPARPGISPWYPLPALSPAPVAPILGRIFIGGCNMQRLRASRSVPRCMRYHAAWYRSFSAETRCGGSLVGGSDESDMGWLHGSADVSPSLKGACRVVHGARCMLCGMVHGTHTNSTIRGKICTFALFAFRVVCRPMLHAAS